MDRMRKPNGLPFYSNAAPGAPVASPVASPVNQPGGLPAPTHCGDSVLLDIEGGAMEADSGGDQVAASWWRPDLSSFQIKTAVFTQLGSAVGSGWSKARGALSGSSITSYMRRVPAIEKPIDLTEIRPPSGPNDI